MPEDQTYLTQEKLEELERELDHLKNIKRREIAQRIQDAKELGDLSENAEYAEAKDNQAWTEGRVLKINDILTKAIIVKNTDKCSNGVINVGRKIKVKQGGGPLGKLEASASLGSARDRSLQDFEIVGSQEADPLCGKISNESPLGKAFIGKKAGDEVEVEVPKGVMKYKIIAVN